MQPPADPDQQPAGERMRAILLVVLAVTMFSCLDATAKYLAGPVGLPTSQIVWMRYLVPMIAVIALLAPSRGRRLFVTNRLGLQSARSVLLLASTGLNFLALRELRLDQTVTISFLAPLTVALMAGPMLGEWMGWRRMLAIFVGFLGVLVVIRPGLSVFEPAMIYSLASMLSYTFYILFTRQLASVDHPQVTLVYSLLAGSFLLAPLAMAEWVWPTDPWQWALLCSPGIWGGVGHFLLILAHRHTQAAVLAPFLYAQILPITLLSYLVFGDLPDAWTIAGCMIIVASGIYLLHRERLVRGQHQPPVS